MINKSILVFFVLVFAFLIDLDCMAQESTLWMRNGKKIAISDYRIDSADYYEGKISYTLINGKQKDKYLEDVFSVVDQTGNEKILYKTNFEMGEILTPDQMKQYVLGSSEARSASISPFILIGGVASGIAGAFMPAPEIELGANSMPIPLGILVPAAYIGVMGATYPNADKLQDNYPTSSSDEHYLTGYQEGIKKKRLKNSIIGAGVGFLAGILVVSAVN